MREKSTTAAVSKLLSGIAGLGMLFSGALDGALGSAMAEPTCAQGTCWDCGGATCYPPGSPPQGEACWSTGANCCGGGGT